MTVDVKFLLTWLPSLFFGRKELVELLDCRGIVAAGVGIALAVEPFSAVEYAFFQFFHEQSGRKNAVIEANAVLLAAFVAACDVVIGISEVYNDVVAQIESELKSMFQECLTAAFALKFGQYAYRTHREYGLFAALFVDEFAFAVHNAADYSAVKFGDVVEFGDKVLVAAHHMDKVMLRAARNTEVPESFAGEIFDFAVIVWVFSADDIVIFIHYFFPPEKV